ncbi:amino acid transporter [Microbacterium sp. NC79]|uniref:amino acid transporter n=1 Tax=Microbacterium sp. NC79 TaxID=2851009 RepID=UPI001C2BF37F|nr:amino acid transporter [Microbacterium sp. NC79]MBV0893688.1 amino acid transporter [Microbacterium sp. NC79]
MTDKKTSRRELMRPVQLLGLAFGAALFAGFITAMSSGLFQGENVWTLTLVMTGSTFIVVLLVLSMLLLAVNPDDVKKQIDRPVLLDNDDK